MNKKLISALAATGLVVASLAAAAPAYAMGSTSWWAIGCGDSYNGTSVYATATGTTNVVTSKAGGGCTNIGAAIRYASGYGSAVNSVTLSSISTSRATLASGGYHSDNNGIVPQHAS